MEKSKIIKKFKYCGFECLICVINGTHYTAYVGIPKNHPFYGKDYEYVDDFVDVHGGVTFSGDEVLGYKKEGVWWFGIDFAHAGDICVGRYIVSPLPPLPLLGEQRVWNLKKVEKEIKDFAKQLVIDNLVAKEI